MNEMEEMKTLLRNEMEEIKTRLRSMEESSKESRLATTGVVLISLALASLGIALALLDSWLLWMAFGLLVFAGAYNLRICIRWLVRKIKGGAIMRHLPNPFSKLTKKDKRYWIPPLFSIGVALICLGITVLQPNKWTAGVDMVAGGILICLALRWLKQIS